MTDEILQKEEIDALLGQPSQDGTSAPKIPQSFDFSKQDKIVRGKMPTLEIIHERFIRNLKVSLYHLMRKTTDITQEPVKVLKFSDYVSSLSKPTSFNIVQVDPLVGNSLFLLDGPLVFSFVETYFGGDGRTKKTIEAREFTPTEIRMTRKLLDLIFLDLMDAWQPILPLKFKFGNTESNPALAKIVSPTELVVVSVFKVEFEAGTGSIQVVLPYSMIEPIKDLLDAGMQSDRDSKTERWIQSIQSHVIQADVEVKCILAEFKLSLSKVVHFKEGDVIHFEMPAVSKVFAEGIPIFNVKFGVHDDKYAVKIVSEIKHGDDQS